MTERLDNKGNILAKIGTIKDRKGMDLTEAAEIKKMWQEDTELYKKDLNDPDNHDGGCKVKWALGSVIQTKLVEVMEFQPSYFKS